jgi:methanethiol S-methyltransferase
MGGGVDSESRMQPARRDGSTVGYSRRSPKDPSDEQICCTPVRACSLLIFFLTFLYAIGFVSGLMVPKSIDSGAVAGLAESIIVDVLLLSVFALQHSVMARRSFKEWWSQFVPTSIERSTYVLLASLALILLFWQWRPIPVMLWRIEDPRWAMAVQGLSFCGWLLVLLSTFMINHFELFGLHQVIVNLAKRAMPEPRFKAPALYKLVRHPIYLGFIIAFWAASAMTIGHLLFAAVTTAYIFVGIFLEERDLVELFGHEYLSYRAGVRMLIPLRRKPGEPVPIAQANDPRGAAE